MMPGELFRGPGPDEVFRRNLADGRFVIQSCKACLEHIFYPRSLCPHCGMAELVTVEASGRGVVYATTVNRRRTEAGGPLNVALIQLEEGPRMMSRVEGVAPEDVAIGMHVTAEIREHAEGPLLVFTPTGTSNGPSSE
jgi:uncharacterized OB-fold protein